MKWINQFEQYLGEIHMYEYKIETYKVNAAEKEMNQLASDGWRVIAVTPNQAMGFGIVVTFERNRD